MDWYTAAGVPSQGSQITSAIIRAEFTSIATKFGLLPDLTGQANYVWKNNSAGNAVEAVAQLAVPQGGTGVATITSGGVVLGRGTSAVSNTGVLANGAIMVGQGAGDPVLASAFTAYNGYLKHEYGGLETDISAIVDGDFIVGTGAGTLGRESGATARASMGLGTNDDVTFDQLTVSSAATLPSSTTVGNLTLADGSITDSSGAINFGNENLSTTGTLETGIATLASGSTIGTLTLSDGVIGDGSGAISFGGTNLSTTGTFGAGATTLSGNLTFTAANPKILGGDADGILYISSGTTENLGGGFRAYGNTHSSKAGDVEIVASNSVKMHFDLSQNEFDFFANAIVTTGTVATGALTVTGNIAVSGTVDGRDVAAMGTKLDFITVTQAVDLDQMEDDIAGLSGSRIFQGSWDASAGTFPGGGTAQTGHEWIVSVAGTVDGEDFDVNDTIVAVTDNASTSVYAANWFHIDNTALVTSVAGKTGAVTLVAADLTDVTITATNLNALDDGANTALHFHTADRSRANHTGTQLMSTISNAGSLATLNTVGTSQIDNDAVTYAKMQNVSATNRIMGRITTGAGDMQELTAANVLTIIGVEAGADVTDTANVTAAGALMDSEVDADIKTLTLVASTNITTYGKSIVGVASEAALKALVNLEIGTDVHGQDADFGGNLNGYTEEYLDHGLVAVGTAIDMSAAAVQRVDLNANITLTFQGEPASGSFGSVMLIIDRNGNYTPTLAYGGGTELTSFGASLGFTNTTNTIDVISVFTVDGGATFFAAPYIMSAS